MRSSRVALLSAFIVSAALISGCQTINQPGTPVTLQQEKKPHAASHEVYLRLYDDTKEAGGVTYIARDVPLIRAIKAAYPDAPIVADADINLERHINVWAEGLSKASYLDHLSQKVDASIAESAQGNIVIHSRAQWQFTLPKSLSTSLMPQALQIAQQAGASTIVMGESRHILLASGKPSQLATVRSALNQLSDRIELERIMK